MPLHFCFLFLPFSNRVPTPPPNLQKCKAKVKRALKKGLWGSMQMTELSMGKLREVKFSKKEIH